MRDETGSEVRHELERSIERIEHENDVRYQQLDRDLDEVRDDLCEEISDLRDSVRDAWAAIVELRAKVQR